MKSAVHTLNQGDYQYLLGTINVIYGCVYRIPYDIRLTIG